MTVVVRVRSQAQLSDKYSRGDMGVLSPHTGLVVAGVLGRLSLRVLGAALIAAGWVARVLADPLQAAGLAAWEAGGSHD